MGARATKPTDPRDPSNPLPSLLQRASAPAVTRNLDSARDSALSWDDAWPEAAERVRRTLERRGAPADSIDDALQSAAVKALSRAEGFDSQEGMVRWVTVVAWNEVIAEWRRQARIEPGIDVEQPASTDPAVIVEKRLEVVAVADGLARLSDRERTAVLAGVGVGPEAEGPEDGRTKMRRYRARQHLAALVEWQVVDR